MNHQHLDFPPQTLASVIVADVQAQNPEELRGSVDHTGVLSLINTVSDALQRVQPRGALDFDLGAPPTNKLDARTGHLIIDDGDSTKLVPASVSAKLLRMGDRAVYLGGRDPRQRVLKALAAVVGEVLGVG